MAALSPSKKSTRAKRCSERIPLTVTCTSPLLGADLLTFKGGNWVISGKNILQTDFEWKKNLQGNTCHTINLVPRAFPSKNGWGKSPGDEVAIQWVYMSGKKFCHQRYGDKKKILPKPNRPYTTPHPPPPQKSNARPLIWTQEPIKWWAPV